MSGVVIDIDCWEAEGCVTSVCLEFRQRTRDSQWAAGPEQTNPPPNCSPPFTLNVCWSLFCLAFIQSFYCPPFVLSAHSLSPWRELAFRHATLSGFLLIPWISSKARLRKRGFRGKKKRGYFFLPLSLSLRHTPMFSFAAQGGEPELARQTAGVVSCNWNWCKGPGVVLPSLPANSSSQHGCTFSRPQSTEETTACQSVVAPRGSPPPPASNIYQSRQNPFEFRAVLRVWPGQTESRAGPERSLYFLWCEFSFKPRGRRSAMNGQREEEEAGH